MKKVLILGAGMVVKPIVTYLLDKDILVTVASRTKSKAEAMIDGHVNGTAVEWTVDRGEELDVMVREHDLTVSLLPWIHHIMVARHCISHKKNMVTTSYVKPEMKALDQEAKDAGIIILNELGLDPGIDHMSAMRIIDHVHNKGGKIEEFYSICGALPAPEIADDNPFRYKFSWSPKGVVLAGNNDGRFLRHGKEVYVPTEDLFKNPLSVDFPKVGKLDIYPNRDSMPYIELYGIPETSTMMRGTFRHPGWCESMDAMKALDLLTNDTHDFTGKSYAEMLAMLIGADNAEDIKQKVAGYLNIPVDAHAMKAMEWLGLFENARMGRRQDTPFEIVSDLMIEKMMIGEKERDMVAMQHVFLASYPDGTKEVIKSSMLDFGTRETDTAIARTVALPAAVGVEMILEGQIQEKGVHIPVIPGIYNPILDALETMDIRMEEEFGLPESEIIK
ncbi:MAG: saccharopine dehydrogenase [Bacteroidia bacterium]|nr:MAG: saccharopine dehydrogenase [Bacteroidia bacterium]